MPRAPATAHAPVHYCITPADTHAHHWHVVLTLARPAAIQRLQLPLCIPGSYMVRELSKHLQDIE